MSDLEFRTRIGAYNPHASRSVQADLINQCTKRSFDLCLALIILLAVAPILIVAIIAIKLTDHRSPVLFKQTRYGLDGQPFTIFKLRTMVPNAEELKPVLSDLSEDKGPGFKIRNDPRVTPVGSVLRKYYIDEIPQLYNVLRGEMALVGPRANSYDPSVYAPWQRRRLSVKPGITGTWQIARDKPTSFDERCQMDIDYIQQQSLKKDLSILVSTALMVMTRASGY